MLDFNLTCSQVTWNRLVFQSLLLNFVRISSMRLWSAANLAPYWDNFFLWILSLMLWALFTLADVNTAIPISVGLPIPFQCFFLWLSGSLLSCLCKSIPSQRLEGIRLQISGSSLSFFPSFLFPLVLPLIHCLLVLSLPI